MRYATLRCSPKAGGDVAVATLELIQQVDDGNVCVFIPVALGIIDF